MRWYVDHVGEHAGSDWGDCLDPPESFGSYVKPADAHHAKLLRKYRKDYDENMPDE